MPANSWGRVSEGAIRDGIGFVGGGGKGAGGFVDSSLLQVMRDSAVRARPWGVARKSVSL